MTQDSAKTPYQIIIHFLHNRHNKFLFYCKPLSAPLRYIFLCGRPLSLQTFAGCEESENLMNAYSAELQISLRQIFF